MIGLGPGVFGEGLNLPWVVVCLLWEFSNYPIIMGTIAVPYLFIQLSNYNMFIMGNLFNWFTLIVGNWNAAFIRGIIYPKSPTEVVYQL